MKLLIASEKALRTELRTLDRAGVGISNRRLPEAEMDRLLEMFWDAVQIDRQLTDIRRRINAAILIPALRDIVTLTGSSLTEPAAALCGTLGELCRKLYDRDGLDRADVRLRLGEYQDQIGKVLIPFCSDSPAASAKASDAATAASPPAKTQKGVDETVAQPPKYDYLAAWDEILPPVNSGTLPLAERSTDSSARESPAGTDVPSSPPLPARDAVTTRHPLPTPPPAVVGSLAPSRRYPTLREMRIRSRRLRERASKIQEKERAEEEQTGKVCFKQDTIRLSGKATDIEDRMEKVRAQLHQLVACALDEIRVRCGAGETASARELALILCELASAMDDPANFDFWLIRARFGAYQLEPRRNPSQAGIQPVSDAGIPAPPAQINYVSLWDRAHLAR